MTPTRCANGGFTLAEVLTASTITVLITLVAVGALKAVSDTSRIVEQATEKTSEVRFAARMIAHDLGNLYRDSDSRSRLLVGASQEADSGGPPSLRFYTVSRMKARTEQPEGDVYEVEYSLAPSDTMQTGLSEESQSQTLFRRIWPNPERDKKPGGILCPIAENINVFQIRFFDGKQWVAQWTQDTDALPQVIEVTLAMVPKDRGEPIVESFVATFPRLAQGTPGGTSDGGSPNGSGQSQGSQTNEPGGEPGEPQAPGGR
jgi:general secretion pathway protein J